MYGLKKKINIFLPYGALMIAIALEICCFLTLKLLLKSKLN